MRGHLPVLAKKAGVTKRVHPHGFRHTHAFELALEGVNLVIIMRQLGHVYLNTTSAYLDHLAPAEVIKAMRERRWTALEDDARVVAPAFERIR